MPFQMPEIRQSNALAMISNIRQQRTQNALAERQAGLQERQFGLTEAAGRRQQQIFETEQANAQRAQMVETTKNVLGALSRVPQAQRQAAFQQLASSLPPEFAQQMAGNPEAFTDQNIALALNRFGALTPDQIFSDKRRETQATTAPKSVITYGADGRPVERYVDIFGNDAASGIVQAPDANAGLSAETARRNADIAAATARRGQDISAATALRGQDLTDRRAGQTGAAADKPTESARLSRGFMMRMQNAERILGQLAVRGVNPGSTGNVIAGSTNLTAGPELRQYRQAANDWIRAKLRRESGASIAPDEMQREFETYFPVYGDDPQTIQQKAEARAIATQGMVEAAALPSAPAMPAGGGWSIEPAR